MQDTNINADELSAMLNSEFLLTKARVIDKISLRLGELSKLYFKIMTEEGSPIHPDTLVNGAKVSKGENYRHLPYLVLDYPRIFQHDATFAFRTMFWWGNYFSFTLHLGGEWLSVYRRALLSNIKSLYNKQYYICIGDTPWQYHFENDNYQQIEYSNYSQLLERDFVKLSFKTELDNWSRLDEIGENCLRTYLDVLKNR